MAEHVKIVRITADKSERFEVDYCPDTEMLVLRCKSWMHFSKRDTEELMAIFRHVLEGHIPKKDS